MIPDVQMADRAVADAHERSYGRLVGWLFRRTGDLQLAEDAVSAAFASAVVTWRRSGVPDSPEAWLRVAARNHALNALRAVTRVTSVPPEVFELREGPIDSIPQFDDRLGLLFVCAHPAVDHRMHAPIMLQAVLGVDAARIGRVFLTAPATMGRRLSRAKAKIRDAGIRFRIPEPPEWRARVGTVLQPIYAVYGVSDPIADGPDDRDELLRAEAVRLARLIIELLPDHAEGWGLLALLLHTESRRTARIVDAAFVPLSEQDVALWSAPLRSEAERALRHAAQIGTPGRFQLEAAISGAHSARADGLQMPWSAITTLYEALLIVAPSVGATISAASVRAELGDGPGARALLDRIAPELVSEHQPYWVCRARVARLDGDQQAVRRALQRALGLTSNSAVRQYLLAQMSTKGGATLGAPSRVATDRD